MESTLMYLFVMWIRRVVTRWLFAMNRLTLRSWKIKTNPSSNHSWKYNFFCVDNVSCYRFLSKTLYISYLLLMEIQNYVIWVSIILMNWLKIRDYEWSPIKWLQLINSSHWFYNKKLFNTKNISHVYIIL